MVDAERLSVVFRREHATHTAPMVQQVNDFLRDAGHHGFTTDTACLAIAGPVEDNAGELTNASVRVNAQEILAGSLLARVTVINDFVAIGHAIANLDPGSNDVLQLPGRDGSLPRPHPQGNRAVLGPGTGLGIAFLPRLGESYHVMTSEGGNALAPYLADHRILIEYLRHKSGADSIDIEEVVSGPGIRGVAQFFLDHPNALTQFVASHHEYADEHEALKVQKDTHLEDSLRKALHHEHGGARIDVAATIAKHAKDNALCRVTMRVFASFLGAAAQDVALHGFATGGVFLTCGIVSANTALLQHGDFMQHFTLHHRLNQKKLLRSIPVYVVLDSGIALRGCAIAIREHEKA